MERQPLMAVREFNIPFGPDKTGGMGFAELGIDDQAEAVKDPFAEPPADAFARARGQELAGLPDEPDLEDIEGFVSDDEPFGADLASEDTGRMGRLDPNRWVADPAPAEAAEPEPEEDGGDDVQTSFAALRDSFGQSRELKARQREIDELIEQLHADREELADREDIIANYKELVAQQDRIIEDASAAREEDKAQLSAIAHDIEAAEDELAEMREFHNRQMQPLESELGRARAGAEQAKNDERSRKSELNAAEAELRKAASSSDATMLQAKVDQFHEAYERACDVSAEAQDILDEVKRIYDDAVNEVESREGPLERSIEDMEHHEADLRESIAQLGDEISAARKRRQYCDAVYQYPEETEKLRQAVAADEEALDEMQMDYDDLSALLAQTKADARKAKVMLGLVLAVVIVIIAVLFIVFTRP